MTGEKTEKKVKVESKPKPVRAEKPKAKQVKTSKSKSVKKPVKKTEEIKENKTEVENKPENSESATSTTTTKETESTTSRGRGRGRGRMKDSVEIVDAWIPKTNLGESVKNGTISDIDEIIDNGVKIFEPEIIDALLPDLENELLLVGQSKGKFGGGQKRVFKQTQKKTKEGNKPKFVTYAIFGNKNGYIGLGNGKSKDTVPAREKAFRQAKMNIIKIKRGCGSWVCGCKTPHSIPFTVEGKVGSTSIKLIPAPKGTGLCIEKECGKMLKLAGITDVWSRTKGATKTKSNLIQACFKALQKLTETKIQPEHNESLGIVTGSFKGGEE